MSKLMLLQDPGVSREQLREQIRKSVQDAQAAAEEAAKQAAQAQGEVIVAPRPPIPPGIPSVGVQINPENMIPPQAETISIAFFVMFAAIIIGYPLARAFGRRIERGTPAPAQISPEVRDQLEHITQSVDAIAIEVERISEAQRFTTKMLADRQVTGLGSGQQ